MNHWSHNRQEVERLAAWLASEGLYAAERSERFAVSGSRNWTDVRLVTRVLYLLPRMTMLNGKARGLDAMAANRWEGWYGPELVEPHPVTDEMWRAFGRRAGRDRNIRMLDRWPRFLLGFRRDGASPGTDHAMEAAEERGIPVFRFRQEVGACAPPT